VIYSVKQDIHTCKILSPAKMDETNAVKLLLSKLSQNTREKQIKPTVYDKVIYSPTNAQVIVLKTILKFTLKQL
jgi:hypothetical protein